MYILITTKEFSEKTKISLQMSKLLFARFCFDYVKDKNTCGRTLKYKLTKKIVEQMIEFAKNLSEHSKKMVSVARCLQQISIIKQFIQIKQKKRSKDVRFKNSMR